MEIVAEMIRKAINWKVFLTDEEIGCFYCFTKECAIDYVMELTDFAMGS